MAPQLTASVTPEALGTPSPPFDPASSLKTLRFWARCWGVLGGLLAGYSSIYASGDDLISPRGGDLFFTFSLTSGLMASLMILLAPMKNVPLSYRRAFSARLAVSMNCVLVPIAGLLSYSVDALPVFNRLPSRVVGTGDIITSVLALPPILLFGLIIATAVSRVPSARWTLECPLKYRRLVWIAPAVATMLAMMASFVDFGRSVKEKTSPLASVSDTTDSVPIGIPDTSFHFEPSEGFEATSPHQWEVITRRQIRGVLAFVTPVLSSDGQHVAFVRRIDDGHAIAVFDLHRDQEIAAVPVSYKPTRIAWSPDNKRIFNLAQKNDACFLSVIDFAEEKEINLPPTKGQELFDCGGLEWPSPNLIALVDEDGVTSIEINLASLISTSIEKKDARRYEHLAEGVLAETDRWQLSLKNPSHLTGHSHSIRMPGIALIAQDQAIDYQRTLYEVKFESPKRIIAASDGSKILSIHDESIDVYYLGLGEGSASEVEVTLTANTGGITELPAEVLELLNQGKLWAKVSPPLINPLNNKSVRPDSHTQTAKLLALSTSGGVLKFAVQESYAPIRTDDVVHTLLTKDDSFPLSTIAYRGNEPVGWWEPIVKLSTKPVEEILPKRKAEIVESPPTQTERPQPPPLAGANETPPIEPTIISSDLPPAEQLIRYLHKAISEDDLAQVKASYADTVDYLSGGFISSDELIEDHRRYRQKWKSITETVIGEVKVKPSSQSTALAFYTLQSTVVDSTGRVVESKLSISLTIANTGGTRKIVRQRASRL